MQHNDKRAVKYVCFLVAVIILLIFLIYGVKRSPQKESKYSVYDNDGFILSPGA